MAAIPAGGSLVATTDYYRSEWRSHRCTCLSILKRITRSKMFFPHWKCTILHFHNRADAFSGGAVVVMPQRVLANCYQNTSRVWIDQPLLLRRVPSTLSWVTVDHWTRVAKPVFYCLLTQGALALHPAAAHVAVRSTAARWSHTTQVKIIPTVKSHKQRGNSTCTLNTDWLKTPT